MKGKFWEYHDLLFENRKGFGEEAFKTYAEILELDAGEFTTCLESGKFQSQIQEDLQEGMQLGITGTPGFFINGIPLTGAQPASVFEEIIDAELATLACTRSCRSIAMCRRAGEVLGVSRPAL